MRKVSRFRTKWNEFRAVLHNEYQHIFRDGGVILIMILAIFIYSLLYSMAYKNQVLRDIPIAVVDHSNTPSSRELVRTFNAAQNIRVTYNPMSLDEAEQLFYARKINGVVYIPKDFEESVVKGTTAVLGVYVDASYFLMYRQVFQDVVGSITHMSDNIKFERLLMAGATIPQAEAASEPVIFNLRNLYNPYLGYGTFVMPAVFLVIIQQTLLIGIGMIGGTWREFGVYRKLRTPGEKRLSTVPVVLGKSLAYLSIYAVTVTYILTIHYNFFRYPMNGVWSDIVLFMVPYLLSCIFLGIAVSTLFRYRENSILYLLWTSIPLLLLSGASLPKEGMPTWMYYVGKIFPSSSGVPGFHRLQTMGADLNEVAPEFTLLWILTFVYFVMACVGIRLVMDKPDVRQGLRD